MSRAAVRGCQHPLHHKATILHSLNRSRSAHVLLTVI